MKPKKPRPARPGYRLVFAARIRLRSGRVLYARDYGRKAFAFWVKA